MKLFTLDLYAQINSGDEDVALAAHDEWERRNKRSRRHYKKIEAQLPEALRKFCAEQCLHDADWNGIARLPGCTFPCNSQEIMIIACQENTLIPEFLNTFAILQYTITSAPVFERPVQAKVFSEVQPTWLYDEIDVVCPGVFSHSILISSGLVVTIHFRDFRYFIAPLLHPTQQGAVSEERVAEVVQSASA
ncbi:MAG TPA: hypothetical protein DDY78_02385 [Planctomycetales bacterium]|jgi:hypothetical protein|nr:hypothetical protein [Planctomycetales bacterium]